MQVRQNVCLYSSTGPHGRVLVNTVQYSEGPSFKSRPLVGTRIAVVDVVVHLTRSRRFKLPTLV
jgi:hypothetical protein